MRRPVRTIWHGIRKKAPARALTAKLMEEVTSPSNLNQAYSRVVSNRGAAGVDGMAVTELSAWLRSHREVFLASLIMKIEGIPSAVPPRSACPAQNIPRRGSGRSLPTLNRRQRRQISCDLRSTA